MAQVLPPAYVAEITFTNNSSALVTVTVNFRSGTSDTFEIEAGAISIVSKQVQYDTWLGQDEILEFTVVSSVGGALVNEFLEGSATSIESRSYIIEDGNAVTRVS